MINALQGQTIVISGFLLEPDGITKIKNFTGIEMIMVVYSKLNPGEIMIPKTSITIAADGLVTAIVSPKDTATLFGVTAFEIMITRAGKNHIGLSELIEVGKTRSKKYIK